MDAEDAGLKKVSTTTEYRYKGRKIEIGTMSDGRFNWVVGRPGTAYAEGLHANGHVALLLAKAFIDAAELIDAASSREIPF